MARRKNVKRIDPRYFMNEKMEKLQEVKIDGYDYGFEGDERHEFNRAMRSDPKAAREVSRMSIEQVADWWLDYKEKADAHDYKPPGRSARPDLGHPYDYPPGEEWRYKYYD